MYLKKIVQSKTARDGSIFAFFSFLNQGLNFFLLIILSNFILPDSYGKLNLFTTGLGIVGYVVNLCTSGIISVKYFKVSRRVLSQYVSVVLSCTVGVSIILLVISTIFYQPIAKVSGIAPRMQWVCVYLCATSVVYNILLDIYRFEEKSIKYGIITTVSTIINIIASLLLVIIFKQDWYGRVEANMLASTFFLLLGLYLFIKKRYLTRSIGTKAIYKETVLFGLPLIPHSVNGWLRQGLDRYIINAHYTSSAVGIFSFAINFSFIIYSVGAAFNKSNSVYIFKSLSEKDIDIKGKLRKQTINMLSFYLLFSIALFIGCWIFIPFIFPYYKDSIIYLFPLCMSTFFQCVYLQFCNFLFYYKKTKQLMYMTVSVSMIHLILSLFLTQYSVLYTAYISMFSSALEALLVYQYSRRLFKFI
ncbi:MAG: polysaccharide biosynthesis protein [Prevotella sp.]|nr:polysaccharide biosynthesis protein [Prevotella sp.]